MFRGPPPEIWSLVDSPIADTMVWLSAEDIANLLRGRAPHDIARDTVALQRVLATGRYLEMKSQTLYEALSESQAEVEAAKEIQAEAEDSEQATRAEMDIISEDLILARQQVETRAMALATSEQRPIKAE